MYTADDRNIHSVDEVGLVYSSLPHVFRVHAK